MAERNDAPELLPCPLCAPIERIPMWWLCQRVTQRDGVNTYALVLNCPHIADVVEWAAPPNGFSPDRRLLGEAWNKFCKEHAK